VSLTTVDLKFLLVIPHFSAHCSLLPAPRAYTILVLMGSRGVVTRGGVRTAYFLRSLTLTVLLQFPQNLCLELLLRDSGSLFSACLAYLVLEFQWLLVAVGITLLLVMDACCCCC
jgi:hypothetical protein